MADTTELMAIVELTDGEKLVWTGDVEIETSDEGVLRVFNYSLREAFPENSGLVLVATRGAWKHARTMPHV